MGVELFIRASMYADLSETYVDFTQFHMRSFGGADAELSDVPSASFNR